MTVEALDDVQAQAEWDRLDGEDLDVPGQTLAQTLATDAPIGLEVDAPTKDNDFPADDKPEQSAVTAADPASPSPSKDPAAPPPDEVKEDPVAALAAQIAALQAQHQTEMRRLHGTIGGLQGQIKSMTQVKAEAAVARAAPEQGGPTKQEIAKAQQSIKEWETLKEDFPDWAAGVEKYVAAQMAAIPQPAAPAPAAPVDVAAVVRQELQQHRAHEQAARQIEQSIEKIHPDWVTTVNSPTFTAWQNSQSQGVQALAHSDDAGDAITLLNLYHMAHPKPAAAADATAQAGKSGAEVIAQRKERLAQAASPTKPVDTGPRNAIAFDDMTDEQQWAYLDELDRRKEARERRA